MYIMGVLLLCLLFSLARMAAGPSVWDRLLGVELVATKTVLLIVLFSSLHHISYLLDAALIYAIFGFVGVIFVAQFIMERTGKGGD